MDIFSINTLLSDPQKFDCQNITIRGLIRRVDHHWYMSDSILDKFDIGNAIEVKERLASEPPKLDFATRYEEFYEYVESHGIDDRAIVKQKLEELKEKGLPTQLDYFIDKKLVEPYDDIVFPDRDYLRSSFFSFVDYKTAFTHISEVGHRFRFFDTQLTGRFESDESGQHNGIITPDTLIIQHKNTLRYIPPVLIDKNQLKHKGFPHIALIDVLQKPQQYIGKQVCIRGVWKKSLSRSLYYIIPGFIIDRLKRTIDKSSRKSMEAENDIITSAHNYIKPHKQFTLQITDEIVKNHLDNGFLEPVGGDIVRSEHIFISGTIKQSEHEDFLIAIDNVAELAYKSELGTYYVDLKR